MNILVTGASGYVGRLLVPRLAALGHHVTCLVRNPERLNLASPEQVEIPAGQKIKLVIKNDGPGPEEFESSDLNREKIIKAGKTAEVTIGPLNPGTYKFIGEFHPQTAQGRIVAK